MIVLIAGLALFFATHFAKIGGYRSALVGRVGESGYKIGYTVVSLAGLVLMIWGYGLARAEGLPILYETPLWMRHVTAVLMLPVFTLFVATYLPGRIKKAVKHPTLAAVKLWAFAHLLTNGDLASILLFGSFLAWAVIGRISVKRRLTEQVAVAMPQFGGNRNDLIAVGAGLAAYAVFAFVLHPVLIGVPVAG